MDPVWLQKISPEVRIVGSMRHERGWVEPRRVIYDHELVLFEKGGFTVTIGGRELRIDSGGWLIVPPGVWHVTREVEARGWMRRWVHFDWTYLPKDRDYPVLTMYPLKPEKDLMRPAPSWIPDGLMHGKVADVATVVELHRRLERRWNNGTAHDQLVCKGLLMELLLEVLDSSERENRAGDESLQLALASRRILERLASQPAASCPPVGDELQKTGCSYAHVSRIFRKSYGMTPVSYINSLRMERARLLLRQAGMNVSEVAAQLGFSSLSYFTRLFTKAEGVSPSAYRNG